jgi:hypothetical protein
MLFNITNYERLSKYSMHYLIKNLDQIKDEAEFYNPFDRGVLINLCEFWLPLFTWKKPS